MDLLARVGFVFGLALAAGCSSSSDKTADPASETGAIDETGATDDAGGDDSAVDAAPAELKAPTLKDLVKMSGALHVVWVNNQTCDFVLIERKDDTTDYKQIFSVKGTFNNKMDGTATADTNYTYRLRCKVGDAMSVYSNELSKNPTK